MRRYLLLLMAALVPVVLGGCYESSTPTLYEPGVYKGSKDPLDEKLESGDVRSELDERLQRAAQDR